MINSLRLKKRITPYILLAPFLLTMCIIFAGGLVQAIVQSLGYLPAFGMDNLSLDHYRRVFTDFRFVSSIQYTFYIALTSSLISVALGVFVAFIVHRVRRGNKLSFALYKVPIVIPHIVVIIMVFHIFFQTGIISRISHSFGLIDNANDFPLLLYDRHGIGIMLVYLYKQVPFVALMVFTILRNLDGKYTQIAENLGAGRLLIMRRITLPLLAPTIFSAFLITFAFGFGAFEVPYLLGSPARVTLPIMAFVDYRSPVLADRPAAMAINVIISIISLLVILLYVRLLGYFGKRGREGGF